MDKLTTTPLLGLGHRFGHLGGLSLSRKGVIGHEKNVGSAWQVTACQILH